MTTLLLRASLIWFSSLLVYELLLKGQTFHRLNRMFLLFTLTAGLLLPLLPETEQVFFVNVNKPTTGELVQRAQHTLSSNVQIAPAANGPSINILPAIYFCGLLVSCAFMLRDLSRILRLYKAARVERLAGWIIAETGAAHEPFSFCRTVFVSDRAVYSDSQWKMVLEHEQQHARALHILDLLLLQLASLAFWFHPAVYIYRRKLRMLHEYEADKSGKADLLTYGSFLLEQAAVAQPLHLTHSFNFSPLKNRILMLTKHPSAPLSRLRFLLLVPLMSVFTWACTAGKKELAIDVKGRFAMLHDAALAYPNNSEYDTVEIMSPGPGTTEQKSTVLVGKSPDRLGGKSITPVAELTAAPRCIEPGSNFGIADVLKKEAVTAILRKMNDGEYYLAISDLIIDQSGHLAYYMLTGPENDAEATTQPGGFMVAKPNGLSEGDKEALQKAIAAELLGGHIRFSAEKNKQGESVPYILEAHGHASGLALHTNVFVRNHQVSFKNEPR